MTLAEQKADEIIQHFRFMLLPFLSFQSHLTESDLMRKCKQCAVYMVGKMKEIDTGQHPFYETVLEILNKKYE